MPAHRPYAHEFADDNFLLLHADWTVQQARQRLSRARKANIDWVIIQRDLPTQDFFLRPLWYVGERLDQVDEPRGSLNAALSLEQWASDAVVDAYAIGYVDGPAIINDHGRPVGFVEPVMESFALSSSDFVEVAMSSATPTPRGASGAAAVAPPEPRSLNAGMDATVPLHQETVLTVTLSAPGVSEAGSLPVAAAVGSDIELLARPLDNVFAVVDNANMGVLRVPDDGSPASRTFTLKAENEGAGKVRVFAFQDGLPLGYLTVVSQVTAAADPRSDERESAVMEIEPRPPVQAPDLSMIVLERRVDDETEITVMLTAADPGLGLNLKQFEPVRLRVSPQAYFQEFFKDIERLPLDTERDERKAIRRLARKGSRLFESLFPADLQALLWSLRDRIEEIQIQSEEPWIPWELCKLQGVEDGDIVEGPFLCETFAITRWMPGIGQKPQLSLDRIALIVPGDSGLTFSKDEFAFVKSLADDQRVVKDIPAYYDDVLDALSAGIYDGVHFSGHGVFRATDPNHSGMELEDGDRLVPEDLSGSVRNLGKARPLVFLNACQLGRSAMSLTDVGGWAPRFLRAGAGAFVGAYWSVYDDSAYAFAQELYTRLLDGEPMGKAVRGARLVARDGGDPSWLAYTVFAHPEAVIHK